MRDKCFVVTGAASGIGAATVRALRATGATVVGVDKVHAAHCDASFACDLADPDRIDAVAREIAGPIHGRIHGLVNVAGVPGSRPPELIYRVNVLAVRRLTERLLPRIADGGAVVSVASAAGSGWRARLEAITPILALTDWDEMLAALLAFGHDGTAAYDFSKELMIVDMARLSGAERGRGVRVNTVSPGAVETPILAEFAATMGAPLLDRLRAQAGGRDAVPAEIADPILFLLGEGARWINGADLLVDGGAEVALTLGPTNAEG